MTIPLTFLLATGLTTNSALHNSSRYTSMMELNKSLITRRLPGPTTTSLPSSKSSSVMNDEASNSRKPRILCLHGKFQSGYIFSNKIAGARRKIEREYELHFLDGPILLPQTNEDDDGADNNDDNIVNDERLAPRSWWLRSEDGKHTLVREAFDYVMQQTEVDQYDAIIGFSQGGTLATALALSGMFPNVQAVCTAGAPYIAEAFDVASQLCNNSSLKDGFDVPKLHLAGETDALVAVDSTRELCQKGGNGKLILHDQGHLFPTRSARVKEVLEFLGAALSVENIIRR
ncbi:hypothetical protein ACHAWU_004485 [Discostella pseudostelligera]|uniref:Serine hydrolase domain-containing protein n=1 Tax=Discostella pseudostelligera TaxID=259834 RepID=A0ABD3M0Y3_9STRA